MTWPAVAAATVTTPAATSLADAAGHLVRLAESRDLTDVVLVGRSWAGYPITGAAGRLTGRLAGIVCYAALPHPGATFAGRLGVPPVAVPGIHPGEIAKAVLAAG